MEKSSEEKGAESAEVEITPEMIEAGIGALKENISELLYDTKSLVTWIYLAMELEKPIKRKFQLQR